jgi:membrane fusion protein, multidrug efflux system
MKVQFRQGDDVKAGDPLFLIDPRPFDAAIQQIEANIAKDTALLRQAEANLRRDTAQEKFARDQAARYQKLFSEGVMSKQATEQYDSDANMRAEVVRADQAAIESSQAALKADTANLQTARLQRAYCEIRSPVDGRTGDLNIEEGNLVRNSDAELVTINQVHPVYVVFSVPENRLAEIQKYMAAGPLSVTANAPGDTSRSEAGQLTFVDNTVDNTTGTIKLKATFPNANSRLWPGQFVNVVLRLKTLQNAVVVPIRAVQMSQDGEFVYVIKGDQSAEMRPVVTGLRLGEEVVVEKGLAKGEPIVIEGQGRLAPGMKVRSRGGRG